MSKIYLGDLVVIKGFDDVVFNVTAKKYDNIYDETSVTLTKAFINYLNEPQVTTVENISINSIVAVGVKKSQ